MAKVPLAFALVLTTLVAGCSSTQDAGDDAVDAPYAFDPDWALESVLGGDDHDHRDPTHHVNLTTPNFHVLGWDPLVSASAGTTPTGMFCGGLAVREDGRQIAVVNSWFTDVAFILMDVTDPAAPAPLGEFVMENAFPYDVDITPDALHVAIAANKQGPTDGQTGPLENLPAAMRAPDLGMRLWFRDTCGNERLLTETPLPFTTGVVLVGIQDPMNPVLEDYKELPVTGPHSVATGEVDGMTVVLASVHNNAHPATYFAFFEVADTAAGVQLMPLSVYEDAPRGGADTPLTNVHVDGTIQTHPITGKTYAYLANWDAGMVIVDITDPRSPTYVSSFTDFGGGVGFYVDQRDGQVHSTLPIPTTWNGRHYTLAAQELTGQPADRASGWVHILDTTDPGAVTYVGSWTLPVEAIWDSTYLGQDKSAYYMFSPHYMALVDHTLFVTQYHAGVWAVDLSDPATMANPLAVGVFMPPNISPDPGPAGPASEPVDYAPCVLDVFTTPEGNLVVFDVMSGVYVAHFDAAHPAPSPPPWTPHAEH